MTQIVGASDRIAQAGVVEPSPETSIVTPAPAPTKPARPASQTSRPGDEAMRRGMADLALARGGDHIAQEAGELEKKLYQQLVEMTPGTPGRDELLDRLLAAGRAKEVMTTGTNSLLAIAGTETPEETQRREAYYGPLEAVTMPQDGPDSVEPFGKFSPSMHAELLDVLQWAAPEQFKSYQAADASLRPWLARASELEAHPQLRYVEGSEPYQLMLDELQREMGDDEFLMNFSPDLGEGRTGRFHRFAQYIAPSHRAEATRLATLLACDKEHGKQWIAEIISFVKRTEKRLANGDYRDTSPESQLHRTRRAMGSRNETRTLLSKGRV